MLDGDIYLLPYTSAISAYAQSRRDGLAWFRISFACFQHEARALVSGLIADITRGDELLIK